jgi:uncharacterized membrane protein
MSYGRVMTNKYAVRCYEVMYGEQKMMAVRYLMQAHRESVRCQIIGTQEGRTVSGVGRTVVGAVRTVGGAKETTVQ